MISMLVLKALSDLGFLYALFSPLLAVFAIPKAVFFAAWILQSLAYALSEKLKDRGWLRFLPFLLFLLPLAAGFGVRTAVFLLPGEDRVHVAFGGNFHALVVQKVRQGDEAVQPVGHPLPSVPGAAHPGGVPYVRPHLVQVAVQAGGLDEQLVFQPAGGSEFL